MFVLKYSRLLKFIILFKKIKKKWHLAGETTNMYRIVVKNIHIKYYKNEKSTLSKWNWCIWIRASHRGRKVSRQTWYIHQCVECSFLPYAQRCQLQDPLALALHILARNFQSLGNIRQKWDTYWNLARIQNDKMWNGRQFLDLGELRALTVLETYTHIHIYRNNKSVGFELCILRFETENVTSALLMLDYAPQNL